jgi:long-subunit acyl-CoA synthetase (AMP-forming)
MCILGYGLTETSPVITASMVGWKDRRLGCVGRALEGVTVKIMDPESQTEVPLGGEGEIWVSGDIVMTGYRNNKAANEEVFAYINGK